MSSSVEHSPSPTTIYHNPLATSASAVSPEIKPIDNVATGDDNNNHPPVGRSKTAAQRGRARLTRPTLLTRKSSGTIIVPRNYKAPTDNGGPDEVYPPDDARAMSPRRSHEETQAMAEATRIVVREHAREVQLNLLEIAESIELVKADHDKLERQNLALQDYIGGLTRSMSKTGAKTSIGRNR